MSRGRLPHNFSGGKKAMLHDVRRIPDTVRVWLLGDFRVSVGTRTIEESAWQLRKAAAIVKLLALSPGHRLYREQLMDLLWPDLGTQAAANNLRRTLHAARRALHSDSATADHCLRFQGEQIALCPGDLLWVDVEAFEDAAVAARNVREPASYLGAVDLYAGDLLPEDRYAEWVEGRFYHHEDVKDGPFSSAFWLDAYALDVTGIHYDYTPGIAASPVFEIDGREALEDVLDALLTD
jgi:hypothetical protein